MANSQINRILDQYEFLVSQEGPVTSGTIFKLQELNERLKTESRSLSSSSLEEVLLEKKEMDQILSKRMTAVPQNRVFKTATYETSQNLKASAYWARDTYLKDSISTLSALLNNIDGTYNTEKSAENLLESITKNVTSRTKNKISQQDADLLKGVIRETTQEYMAPNNEILFKEIDASVKQDAWYKKAFKKAAKFCKDSVQDVKDSIAYYARA